MCQGSCRLGELSLNSELASSNRVARGAERVRHEILRILQSEDGQEDGRPQWAQRRCTRGGQRIRELEKELNRKDKALAEAAALIVLKKSPGDLGGRLLAIPQGRPMPW